MFELTDEFLSPKTGTIRCWPAAAGEPRAGTWSIDIPIDAFSADDPADPTTYRLGVAGPEIVHTRLRLDFISLPAAHLAELGGRSFAFPVNPEDGYIDGSIYLGQAHNPVDVTEIDFGSILEAGITARLCASFDFTQEHVEIANRSAILTVALREDGTETGQHVYP
ncbi:hypothetical protein [Mycobacterium sp. NPDC006124]|uniref:hypothetical protein n=1 Tax=Mycobacterium sp. NPDC006124 TaxID=3156729 RepID=UPI0033AF5885